MSDKKNISGISDTKAPSQESSEDEAIRKGYEGLEDSDEPFDIAVKGKKKNPKKTKEKTKKSKSKDADEEKGIFEADDPDLKDDGGDFLSRKRHSDDEVETEEDEDSDISEDHLIIKGKKLPPKKVTYDKPQNRTRRTRSGYNLDHDLLDEQPDNEMDLGDFSGNSGDSNDDEHDKNTEAQTSQKNNLDNNSSFNKLSFDTKQEIQKLNQFINLLDEMNEEEFNLSKAEVSEIIQEKFKIYYKRCRYFVQKRQETNKAEDLKKEQIFCRGAKLTRDIQNALDANNTHHLRQLIELYIRPYLKKGTG